MIASIWKINKCPENHKFISQGLWINPICKKKHIWSYDAAKNSLKDKCRRPAEDHSDP